jgi:hypothetical protein
MKSLMRTKDDVLNEMHTGRDILLNFDLIPVHLLDAEVVTTWMTMRELRMAIHVDLSLRKIPRRFINDALLLKAIDLDYDALNCIKPDMAEDYLSLVLHSVRRSEYAYRYIDPSYHTEAMLDEIILHANQFLNISTTDKHLAWIRDLMTQERIDRVSATNFPFASRVGLEKMEWGALKSLLKNSYAFYGALDSQNQLHFLTRMLAEGEWPVVDPNDSYLPVRSKSLADGMLRMMIGSNPIHQRPCSSESFYMYKAYVMTYPIEEVVAAMQTPERLKVLLEMYTTDELRPHMHLNRNLRGALLEEALGL